MSKWSVAACLIVLAFIGCKEKDRAAMPIKTKMQAICIGRHLIDIPSGFRPMMPLSGIFRVSQPGNNVSSIDVSVLAEGITRTSFGLELEKRRAEILASTRGLTKVLKEEIVSANDSKLFRVQKIEDAYTSELHTVKGKLYVMVKADSYENRFQEVEKELINFTEQITEAENVVERRPGFCFGAALLRGLYDSESVTISFRSEERPDILITVEVDTFGLDEPVTLLQRVSGPNSLLELFNAQHRVLRKGELQVAGMHAQEWLGSANLGENRDNKQFGFTLETRRSTPNLTSPRLLITLDSGQYDGNGKQRPNSLTDEQAIALWDSIISSIRVRVDASQ